MSWAAWSWGCKYSSPFSYLIQLSVVSAQAHSSPSRLSSWRAWEQSRKTHHYITPQNNAHFAAFCASPWCLGLLPYTSLGLLLNSKLTSQPFRSYLLSAPQITQNGASKTLAGPQALYGMATGILTLYPISLIRGSWAPTPGTFWHHFSPMRPWLCFLWWEIPSQWVTQLTQSASTDLSSDLCCAGPFWPSRPTGGQSLLAPHLPWLM